MPKPQRKPVGRPKVPRMNKQRTVAAAKKGASGSSGSTLYNLDLDFYKPKKETRVFRIIPYIVTDERHPDNVPAGELWWKRPMKIHPGVGPDEKWRQCLSFTGQVCPICKYGAERKRQGDATDEELKSYRAKDRDLYIIEFPEEPGVLYYMETSFYTFTQQLCKEIDEDPEEFGGFADLIDGFDLKVRWTETPMGKNSFIEADRIDFITRRKPVDPAILDDVPSLDDCLTYMTPEDLEAAFYGEVVDEQVPANESESNEEQEEYEQPNEEDEIPFDPEPEQEPEPEEKPAPTRKPVEHKKPAPKPVPKETPTPTRKPKNTPSKAASDGDSEQSCPAGGTFGTDCNALEECDTCDTQLWESCMAAQEAAGN